MFLIPIVLGGILSFVVMFFTAFCLTAMVLRVYLGDVIHKREEFWCFLATFLNSISTCGYFYHRESFCDFICFTFPPSHVFLRISRCIFVYSKLKLHRIVVQEDAYEPNATLQRVLFFLIVLFSSTYFVKVIERLLNGGCYPYDEPGACFIEQTTSISSTYGIRHIPNLLFTTAEVVFIYQFSRASWDLYNDCDFIENKTWFKDDLVHKVKLYAWTSLVMLITNTMYAVGAGIFGFTLMIKGCQEPSCIPEHSLSWLYCMYVIHNLIVAIMVAICFPLKSFNIYRISKAISSKDYFQYKVPIEFTAQQLRECVELETQLQKNTDQNANKKKKIVLPPHLRPIQKSWMRHPITKKIIILDTPSPSLSLESEDSSSGILLVLPPGYDDQPQKSNNQLQAMLNHFQIQQQQ